MAGTLVTPIRRLCFFSDQGTVSQDRDLKAESEEEFIERWKNYPTGESSNSCAVPRTGGQGETPVPPFGPGSGDSAEGAILRVTSSSIAEASREGEILPVGDQRHTGYV